ncbi:MAG: DcrB-related protein [Armatimonadetes bacterium]|nr:DcrB-related protein [Armatimonadota bacterium]
MRVLVLCILWMAGLLLPAAAWEDTAVGIRFAAPRRWEARQKDPGARVRFVAPAAPGLRSNIGFQIVDLDPSQPLDEQQILTVARRLASDLQDYRMLGSKAVSVAGLDGHRLSYRAVVKGKPIQATQVFAVRAGRLLLFTLTTEPDKHPAGRTVLDSMLSSIEWLDEPR